MFKKYLKNSYFFFIHIKKSYLKNGNFISYINLNSFKKNVEKNLKPTIFL